MSFHTKKDRKRRSLFSSGGVSGSRTPVMSGGSMMEQDTLDSIIRNKEISDATGTGFEASQQAELAAMQDLPALDLSNAQTTTDPLAFSADTAPDVTQFSQGGSFTDTPVMDGAPLKGSTGSVDTSQMNTGGTQGSGAGAGAASGAGQAMAGLQIGMALGGVIDNMFKQSQQMELAAADAATSAALPGGVSAAKAFKETSASPLPDIQKIVAAEQMRQENERLKPLRAAAGERQVRRAEAIDDILLRLLKDREKRNA